MTAEFQDSMIAKAERGPWKILSLMALYLVLAVAVGVARGELRGPHPAAAGPIPASSAPSAG